MIALPSASEIDLADIVRSGGSGGGGGEVFQDRFEIACRFNLSQLELACYQCSNCKTCAEAMSPKSRWTPVAQIPEMMAMYSQRDRKQSCEGKGGKRLRLSQQAQLTDPENGTGIYTTRDWSAWFDKTTRQEPNCCKKRSLLERGRFKMRNRQVDGPTRQECCVTEPGPASLHSQNFETFRF